MVLSGGPTPAARTVSASCDFAGPGALLRRPRPHPEGMGGRARYLHRAAGSTGGPTDVMSVESWEAKVLAAAGASERVDALEQALRSAAGLTTEQEPAVHET